MESDAPCVEANIAFVPVATDTFGAYDREGERFMGQLFSRYAKQRSCSCEAGCPGQFQQECWQRVAVALRKAKARQLSSAYSQA